MRGPHEKAEGLASSNNGWRSGGRWEMGDRREGRRAIWAGRRGAGWLYVIMYKYRAAPRRQAHRRKLAKNGRRRQICADRVDTISWWWLRASQLLWVKVPIWLWSEPYKQCALHSRTSLRVLHKIHERRSLIVISQETCQYWLSCLPLPEQRVQRHSMMHG
jgi:hypothetical protein